VLKDIGKIQPVNRTNLIEILFCCNGVKLYYIESNGEVVSSVDDDYALRIVRLGCDFELNLDETIFLQLIKTSDSSIDIGQEITEHQTDEKAEICSEEATSDEAASADQATTGDQAAGGNDEVPNDPSFIYPLIPGVSPCFRTKFNAYVLPDLQSNDGSAIGLMIPPGFDEIVLDILITILKGVVKDDGQVEFGDFTSIGDEVSRAKRSTGDKVSENIVTGAQWISLGLTKTAQKTGEFIDYSTPYILSKMQKAPENTPPVSVKVQASVVVAKSLTGYAAQGTSFVAGKVGTAMTSFGKFLAPHVQKQGSKLLSYASGMESERAEETMTETLKIVSGAADGISTIYGGLETSAGILGRNLADNTVKIVGHKYGEPIAGVTSNTFDTVGNLYNVNRNFNIMTPKGLVKSTAKSAGKGILQSDVYKPKIYLNKNYFTGQVHLYPNLDNLAKELNKPRFGQL
jgi:Senescence-associated protein